MKLRLATRGSTLAWGQSGQVADALRALGHEVELVKITTHGDVTTAPLASLGGAGVFVGAVRAAVLSGECDFAVHSFKDLPTVAADDLRLAAVPPREDPADALCTADGRTLTELAPGARVGTGSPRRAAQVLALRPDLSTVEIRGNVETRLARAGADLDAVILAAAGLSRIGLGARISQTFDTSEFLPAPAQGALALECRSDATDVLAALAGLDHPASRLAAIAERAVLSGLHAGCAAPVGAIASLSDGRLHLHARVISLDGATQISERASTAQLDAEGAAALGATVTAKLLAAGAGTLVDLSSTKPKPLHGRSLLLPKRCPAGLVEALTSAGAQLTQVEFTRQEPLSGEAFVSAAQTGCDWLVFSSAATVAALSTEQETLHKLVLDGARLAAVGPTTARAMAGIGLEPELVAEPGGGTALVAAFPDGPGVVLLPSAAEPSAEPAAGLVAKGWTVLRPAVYRTVPVAVTDAERAAWPAFDAVILTAGSVTRAVAALGLTSLPAITIGAPTAAAARESGLSVIGVAPRPNAGGLVDAVLSALC